VASVDIEAGTLTVTPPLGLFEELASDDVASVEVPSGETPTESTASKETDPEAD
jgi:16S rRNA processing protein RimM